LARIFWYDVYSQTFEILKGFASVINSSSTFAELIVDVHWTIQPLGSAVFLQFQRYYELIRLSLRH
jgi:hypothetical protein